MPGGIYRVTLNGFTAHAETWDDALEWDGKGDEVFTSVSIATYDAAGNLLFPPVEHRSPVLGDTNNQNGRVQAGTRSANGGLRSGDTFPTATPWIRGAIDVSRNYPPCSVWSGTLIRGQNLVAITPSIWEWDPGQYFLDGWLQWASTTARNAGPQLKALLGAGGGGVVDATTLGLDVAVSLFDHDLGVFGSSGSRPIGMRRSPTSGKFDYTPKVLLLNYDVAEYLVNTEANGQGMGVMAFSFPEDPRLRGDYVLYLQIEKLGEVADQPRTLGRYSLRSLNATDHFLRHRNFLYEVTPVNTPLDQADATVEIVPGLGDPSLVSLKAVNVADHYLRHEHFRIKLSPRSSDPLFEKDATFRMMPGLAAPAGFSFESLNFPGRYIRHRDFHAYLEHNDPTDAPFKADATFFTVRALA